jgi:hypothetical protein
MVGAKLCKICSTSTAELLSAEELKYKQTDNPPLFKAFIVMI